MSDVTDFELVMYALSLGAVLGFALGLLVAWPFKRRRK